MKTFDEAVLAVTATTEMSAGEFTEMMHSKFAGIAQEAAANDRVRSLIGCGIRGVADNLISVEQCLFSLFMNGLVTGIEMERQDVGVVLP